MKINAIIYLTGFMMVTLWSPANLANPLHQYVHISKQAKVNDKDILTHLMLADLAAKRNMHQIALDHYMLVATQSHDPQVAQLATEYALALQDQAQAIQAAKIWAHSDPNNTQAQLIAATLVLNDDPKGAKKLLLNAFTINEHDLDEYLLDILSSLTPEARIILTNMIDELATEHANNPYINLASAQLFANQLAIEQAEKKLNLALNLKNNLTHAIELKAKIIRYKSQDELKALSYLDQQINLYPDDSELRMFYVTALLDNGLTDIATPHLQKLSNHPQYGGDAMLLLGEIYVANQENKKS